MNGNYEWQKQLVNERVQTALQEADEHLYSRSWRRKSLARTALRQIILGGAGLILIVLLVSGCTPVSPALFGTADLVEKPNEPAGVNANFPLPYSLEDLIRYYAPFREAAAAGSEIQNQSSHPWSVTDRIRFQDRLLEAAGAPESLQELDGSQAPWSIADRIRFHDRIQDGGMTLDGLDMKDLGNLQRWGLDERY